LHNMVDHNTKIKSKRKFPFPTYIVWFLSTFVAKKCMSLCTKNCKYTQNEMIFSFYEIYNIY
jgi:hypothetical protein